MSAIKKILGNSFFRRLFNIIKNKYLLATIAFLILIFFVDTNNVISWYKDMKEVSAQKRQIQRYKDAIIDVEESLQELSSNKDSLEKFAREQFLFHQSDEDVFVVEP